MAAQGERSKEVLKSIGERLKEAREKKNLSVEDVHRHTRIHPHILTSMEEGRIEESLSGPYVKGFLKKYASFLGLKSEELLKDYVDKALGPIRPASIPAKEAPPCLERIDRLTSEGEVSLWSPILKTALGLIFIILILSVVSFTVRSARVIKAEWSKRLASRPPAAAPKEAPPAKAEQKKGAVAPKKTAVAKTAAAKPRAAPKAVAAEKSVTAAKPVEAAKPVLAAGSVTQAQEAAAPLIKSVNIPADKPIELVIKVKRKVFIWVMRDDETLFKTTLSPGAEESITAKNHITISAGDLSAISLVLNGTEVGPLGKGQAKSLEVTRQGVKLVGPASAI